MDSTTAIAGNRNKTTDPISTRPSSSFFSSLCAPIDEFMGWYCAARTVQIIVARPNITADLLIPRTSSRATTVKPIRKREDIARVCPSLLGKYSASLPSSISVAKNTRATAHSTVSVATMRRKCPALRRNIILVHALRSANAEITASCCKPPDSKLMGLTLMAFGAISEESRFPIVCGCFDTRLEVSASGHVVDVINSIKA
mmetsp:Transcript_26032/g.68364  ORF Transcript_26032/g.68364 Transcript_26032/m.68364 type:complete len:201 (-) Transcript_26032:39-641(-)